MRLHMNQLYGNPQPVKWKSDWWELYAVLTAGLTSAVALVTLWG